jgi:hypothetical protein
MPAALQPTQGPRGGSNSRHRRYWPACWMAMKSSQAGNCCRPSPCFTRHAGACWSTAAFLRGGGPEGYHSHTYTRGGVGTATAGPRKDVPHIYAICLRGSLESRACKFPVCMQPGVQANSDRSAAARARHRELSRQTHRNRMRMRMRMHCAANTMLPGGMTTS